MITGLRLGNFKAFGETQHIPIKPITLIFGANSSGKSSILHGLLLACQALDNGNLDAHKTRLGGNSVDLGGFYQYVHRRDKERQVVIGFTIPSLEIGDPSEPIQLSSVSLEIAYGAEKDSEDNTFAVYSYRIKVGDETVALICRDNEGSMMVTQLSHTFPDLTFLCSPITAKLEDMGISGKQPANDYQNHGFHFQKTIRVEKVWEEDEFGYSIETEIEIEPYSLWERVFTREYLEGVIESLLKTEGISVPIEIEKSLLIKVYPYSDTKLYRDSSFRDLQGKNVYASDNMSTSSSIFYVRPDELKNIEAKLHEFLSMRMAGLLEDILRKINTELTNSLKQTFYLGPLRAYPSRRTIFSDAKTTDRFASGEFAWALVNERDSLREKVNEWLGDRKRLCTPYQFVVRRYLPDGHNGTPLKELVLRDKRFDTDVSPRDIGIGISQALPLLVAAFALKGKIIAIEQPEIHLHPALQAELGDVFIKSALGDQKNAFLLETHSEHLILRIMRRMRETARGSVEKGLEVRPEDVAILYVQRKEDDSSSVVMEMELDEEGRLLSHWPGGFFEEGFREQFS